MAIRAAQSRPDCALSFLLECTVRLSQLEAPRRLATLTIIAPWLDELDMSSNTAETDPGEVITEHQALSNLVYLAVRFGDDHMEEIKEIFLSFAGAGNTGNSTALVKYLFEQGGRRKSSEFVMHAQRILACFADSEAGDHIFEEICNFVEPSAMAALPETNVQRSPLTSLADLDTLMRSDTTKPQLFSTGQLALLFACQLLPSRTHDEQLGKRLPTLLHVALAHCDHASPALREQSQMAVFQVLRAWICDISNVPAQDAAAVWSAAELKDDFLIPVGNYTVLEG